MKTIVKTIKTIVKMKTKEKARENTHVEGRFHTTSSKLARVT
jgi:hypothetical protein